MKGLLSFLGMLAFMAAVYGLVMLLPAWLESHETIVCGFVLVLMCAYLWRSTHVWFFKRGH